MYPHLSSSVDENFSSVAFTKDGFNKLLQQRVHNTIACTQPVENACSIIVVPFLNPTFFNLLQLICNSISPRKDVLVLAHYIVSLKHSLSGGTSCGIAITN